MSSTQVSLPFARHRGFPIARCLALLLIDFQRAFVDPSSKVAVPGAAAALRRAVRLQHAFTRSGLPIAITRHAHRHPPPAGGMGTWWTHFLCEGEPGSQCMPELLEPPGPWLIRKSHYSAFKGTRLERWLRSRGATDLVIAGVMTHVCVDTTARDAFMRGFNVTVIHDACASKHPALHQASLLGLSHAVARVCSTRQAIDALRRIPS